MKLIIGKYEDVIYPEANGYTRVIDIGANGKGDRIRLEAGIETSDTTGATAMNIIFLSSSGTRATSEFR